MSDLFSGLEKFGFDKLDMDNIFEDEKAKPAAGAGEKKEAVIPKEEDFLLDKGMQCPICDNVFKTRAVKNGRARRLDSDRDLRPKYEYVDPIKYDVSSCPKCGYTAINRYFGHLSGIQAKMIREEICSKFKPDSISKEVVSYTYDEAIERYKLALITTIAKKGKASEKAYACLKLAWLYRGKKEEIIAKNPELSDANKASVAEAQKMEMAFYAQAFDGFIKAMSSESYPMCGMEQNTVDFLIANMAYNLKKFDVASRMVATLLTSRTVSKQIKDKALVLKEDIIAEIKKTAE